MIMGDDAMIFWGFFIIRPEPELSKSYLRYLNFGSSALQTGFVLAVSVGR